MQLYLTHPRLETPNYRGRISPQAAMATPSSSGAKAWHLNHPADLHFGMQQAGFPLNPKPTQGKPPGKNGVFFTYEVALPGFPSSGGLAMVSYYIPATLNTAQGQDMRVILPANKKAAQAMAANPQAWKETGETITLPVPFKAYNPQYLGDETATFKVYQNYNDKAKLWTYALSSDSKLMLSGAYVANTKENYVGLSEIDDIGAAYGKDMTESGAQLMLLCNQAMVELAKRLDPAKTKLSPGSTLKQFDGPVSQWVGNDWITGPALVMPEADPDVAKTFIHHNIYDKTISPEAANAFGLSTPSLINASMDPTKVGTLIINQNFYNTLVNGGFLKQMGLPEQQTVLKSWDANRVVSMDHMLSPDFSNPDNPILKGEVAINKVPGYSRSFKPLVLKKDDKPLENLSAPSQGFTDLETELDPESPTEATISSEPIKAPPALSLSYTPSLGDNLKDAAIWLGKILSLGFWKGQTGEQAYRQFNEAEQTRQAQHQAYLQAHPLTRTISQANANRLLAWKAQNKQAVQQLYGLKQDANSVLFCAFNRMDNVQKMMTVVLPQLEAAMKRHPEVQAIINSGYKGDNKTVNAYLNTLISRYPDRFRFVPFEKTLQAPLQAGADYAFMVSNYEPYGTSQLYAYQCATPPIGTLVDGLHSTMSDPAVNSGPQENVWQYDRTCLAMDAVDPAAWAQVCSALDKHPPINPLGSPVAVENAAQRLPAPLRPTYLATQKRLERLLDEAVDLRLNHPQQYALLAKNGMDYVYTEHTGEKIGARYLPAFQTAEAHKAAKP